MPSNYPGTLDVLTNPTPTDPLASATVPHSAQHTNINDIIEAIQAKLGIGAGAPPGSGAVFGSNGAGGSLWRQVANADVASAAAIAYSKLALAGSLVNADVATAAAIAYSKLALGGSIVNADVATAAAIALSKLAPGSSGVLKSNGTAISAGNLVGTTDLAANATYGNAQGSAWSNAGIISAPWVSASGIAAVQLTTTGGLVLVGMFGTVSNTLAGNAVYYGISATDGGGPTYTGTAQNGAGWSQGYGIVGYYIPAAGLHTWSALVGVQGGTGTLAGQMWAVELKR